MSSTKDMNILKGLFASLMLITAAQFFVGQADQSIPLQDQQTSIVLDSDELDAPPCHRHS